MNDIEEPGNGEKKHPEKVIYIANLSEDVWPFIQAMSDPVARKREIDENAALCDRDLFALSNENHVLFITPSAISEEFTAYYKELIGIKNFDVAVTQTHTGEICSDILRDEDVLKAIEDAANSSRKVTLLSYATSLQFIELVETLRKKGIAVTTPEAPDEENAWTVNFFGSKSGIRQLSGMSSAKEPDFAMPEGLICVGSVEAARIAANKYVKNQGVVIKTNKGHSGAGILIFRPGDLPLNYQECESKILSMLKKDAYWDLFPIVIEEFIQPAITVAGGYPSLEYRVLRNGHIEFLYYCALRVTKDGVFKGILVNSDVVPGKQAAQIVDTGFYIAEQLSKEGYRGYFDIDFVAGKNGKLYVTEANVRRTGGTHVLGMAERFFGKDFMYKTYIISDNWYPLGKKIPRKFNDLLEYLKPILFDKTTKEGIVIAQENNLPMGHMSYVIFAGGEKKAMELQSKLEELLG